MTATRNEGVQRIMAPRILVVEDERIVAEDLQQTLRGLGYTVCGSAASGERALEVAVAARPDLVLMDVRLEGHMDGIEAADLLRERLDVPVVFLTAHADEVTVQRAAEVAPYGYVIKPFEERELYATVTLALSRHRAFAELDERVRQRTEELLRSERRYRKLEAVAALALAALETPDLAALEERAVEAVRRELDADLSAVFHPTSDGALELRAGVGWKDGALGARVPPGAAPQSLPGHYALDGAPELLREHDVRHGAAARIPDGGSVGRGVLAAYWRTPQPREGAGDRTFLSAVAAVIGTAMLRAASDTRLLEAQRAADAQRLRKEQAEEMVARRDELLVAAAHELRTPVAALLLAIEVLATADADPVVRRRTMDRIVRNSQRLAALIERVLDVARIQMGELALDRRPMDAVALIADAVEELRCAAEEARCELRLHLPDVAVRASWDAERVTGVLRSLLTNAFKFGPGQPVDVGLEVEDDRARVTVRDRGIGLPAEAAQRIFRPYGRAAPVLAYPGLGLGLFVSRAVVEAHGGSLGVEPTDVGTCFVIELPCERASARAGPYDACAGEQRPP